MDSWLCITGTHSTMTHKQLFSLTPKRGILETNEILRSVHFHKITNMLRPKVIIVDARDLTGCMSGIWRATETIERTFPLDTNHSPNIINFLSKSWPPSRHSPVASSFVALKANLFDYSKPSRCFIYF